MFEGEIWTIPILIISMCTAWLSVTLSRWANGRFMRPTISNWFMWWLFIYIYIGASYLMVVRDGYEEVLGLFVYPEAIMGAWGLSLAGVLLIPLGMNIANVFCHVKPNGVWKGYINKLHDIIPKNLPISFHITFAVLAATTILVTLLYYQQIDIPIMGVFAGSEAEHLALLRSDATNNFSGKYYRYNFFKTSLLTLLVLVSFFLRKRGAYRYAFWGLLGLRGFSCIADIQKAPIIQLMLVLLLALYFEKHKINKKILGAAGLVIVGGIITMVVFFMGANISNAELFVVTIGGILRRIFVAGGVGVDWSIVYVDKFGFLGGASMPNPAGILPFTNVRYSVELMEMVFPQLVSIGVVGSMPTVFWGEIYANYGTVVAIFSMVIVGMFLRTMDIYFQTYNSNNKVLNLSLYVFMITKLQKYTTTSIQGIFTDQDIWLIIFIVIVWSHMCPNNK